MAELTAIEWADRTWSPWIGCQKVGPGCDHCYAEALNKRTGGGNWGPGAPRRRTSAAYWRQPRKWNAAGPSSVFPSLCDPFDNAVPDEWRADFADQIRATPNLTWLLVTKRIGNAAKMLAAMFPEGAPASVWIGATIVNQPEADRDIPKLLATPAGKRFLSMEPLLGPVDLTALTLSTCTDKFDAFEGMTWTMQPARYGGGRLYSGRLSGGHDAKLDWIIVGGESGVGARPMHPDWARSLRDQCAAVGVPFLFKQWGEWAPGECSSATLDRPSVRVADWFDGAWSFGQVPGGFEFHADDEPTLFRAGKKAAGRRLDGVTHDGMPSHAR